MGNQCMKRHLLPLETSAALEGKLARTQECQTSKKARFGHRRLGSTTSNVSGDDIKLVWASSKDSSNLFDKLGAKDIFKRFNTFLEKWKYWQDEERLCKELLGFDLEMKLVDSLCGIPSGMRVGLGCGSATEEYDFYLDINPIIQLNELNDYLSATFQKAIEIFKSLAKQMKVLIEQGELICRDLNKILDHLEESVSSNLPAELGQFGNLEQQLDNPEQVMEALTLVKSAVQTLKSHGCTITNYIMQQGHNVDIVVSNKQSSNPTLVIFPKSTISKMNVQGMNNQTIVKLNQREDDEKYIEISLR